MSMVGEKEDEEDCWSDETGSYVSDSMDGGHSKGKDSDADSLDRRGKRALSDDAAVSSIFRTCRRKKGEGEEKQRKGKEKVVDRVNPDDYPELAKFVKLGVLGEEAQRNWSVIGDENATMLQKRWIEIMDKQLHLSLWKTDLIKDIFSFITDDDSSDSKAS